MGNDKDSPLSEADLKAQYVFDLIYSPKQTKLLRMAAAKGLHTISGSEMFVHQGARQFEIWTGKPAPVDVMQQVVDKALEAPVPEANGNGKQAKKKAAR
jgi:3-dehydroquinate dehydratase/shikimate dehydrogenase